MCHQATRIHVHQVNNMANLSYDHVKLVFSLFVMLIELRLVMIHVVERDSIVLFHTYDSVYRQKKESQLGEQMTTICSSKPYVGKFYKSCFVKRL